MQNVCSYLTVKSVKHVADKRRQFYTEIKSASGNGFCKLYVNVCLMHVFANAVVIDWFIIFFCRLDLLSFVAACMANIDRRIMLLFVTL